MPDAAFALRPFRIDERSNDLILFTTTTFPKNPRAGCEIMLRRAEVCGPLDYSMIGNFGVDVLDENGDILQAIGLCRNSFEYLRRKLKFRREKVAV